MLLLKHHEKLHLSRFSLFKFYAKTLQMFTIEITSEKKQSSGDHRGETADLEHKSISNYLKVCSDYTEIAQNTDT